MKRGTQQAHNLTAFSAVDASAIAPLKLDDLLKRFVQVMPIGYIVWDTEFRAILWNPAAEKIFGFSASEALGKTGYELIVPSLISSGTDNIWSWVLVGDAIAPNIKQNITKDGRPIICEWFNTPFRTADGTVVVLSLVQDITQSVKATLSATQAQEALQESEERYRQIVETTSEGIWMIDAYNRTTFVNYRMAEMLGYTVDEMQGMSLFEFMEEEDRVNAFTLIERRRQGIDEQHDFKFRRQDGSHLWAIVCTTPICDRTQKYAGALAMITDITARKNAEEELRQMSLALENAVEGISRLDTQGRYVAVNKAYASITGYTPEEMIGMNWQLTVYPEDLDNLAAAYELMLINGKVEVEARGIRQDGSIFYKALVMICAYNQQRQFIGHYCFMKDITARKQTEEQLRQQAALIDIIPDAIIVRDLQDRISFWNKGAETLYGWDASSAIGQKFSQLLFQETSPQLQAAEQAIAQTNSWQGELRQVTQAGKAILVESRWKLMRDAEGKPKSIIVVTTDITEKKQLEEQFFRTQRLESIGTLASGIAHDLNNILTPILASVQLLRKRFPDSRSEQLLNMLEDSTRRGADLVKQVLSFGRGFESDRTTLQINHLVAELAKIARETFPRAISVWTDLPNDLWLINGDVTQLHQVLMNLMVNARDAMPDGGSIGISAENFYSDESYTKMHQEAKVGPYIAVTITDTGMGIPAEILDKIFQPFFTTKDQGKGTGLGLSTVMGIVKKHGGFIDVTSEVGKGTQFKLFLPAVPSAKTNCQNNNQRELHLGNGEWILVADDEASIREITKTSLETYAYNAITASDGIEAIALYAQHKEKISIVLIDLMMPVMDGITTIRTLQKINPQVKVVAVSGLESNPKPDNIKNINLEAFLAKPYTAVDLLTVLHEVLAK